MQVTGTQIPSKGDRVEQRRLGVIRHGHVWYADQLQVLVKWEDGKSSSLRLGCDYIATPAGQAARREEEVAEAALPELAGVVFPDEGAAPEQRLLGSRKFYSPERTSDDLNEAKGSEHAA